jgi:hypothetical protein
MKKINYLTLILITTLVSCIGSRELKNNRCESKEPIKNPSDFFLDEKAKVLVVGTFHFTYPGLDGHLTDSSDQIDVLSEKRSREVIELVNYIKKFKPNKIAVEAYDKDRLTEKLREYKNGKLELPRGEEYQLGFRIAKDFNLDTIYALENGAIINEIWGFNGAYFDSLRKDYDYKSSDPMDSLKNEWYNYQDKLLNQVSLLEYIKHHNSKEYHEYDYGTYLYGDFKLDEHRGPDFLSLYWYNRNLRIFRKLQNITDSKDDRILIIYGNAHAALLRQFLTCSPEYEFVEFNKL